MTILKIGDELKTYMLQTVTIENCNIDDGDLLNIFPNENVGLKNAGSLELELIDKWLQKLKNDESLEKVIISLLFRFILGKSNLKLDLITF